jgi:uncharacterized membrane protein
MTIKKRISHFAWELHDPGRSALSFSLGAIMALISWKWLGFSGKIAFLAGWILSLAVYLFLLGIVIFQADGPMTKQRVSQDQPNRALLLLLLIMVALMGNISVGVILTSVGSHHPTNARLLVGLGVWAVIMSWLLLHTAAGQHYARLYYEDIDREGRPFTGGMRQGLEFPGGELPTYLDFMYFAFTVGLTYAVSDVNVTSADHRLTVFLHSVVSFFFYTTILGVVLNAIVTS